MKEAVLIGSYSNTMEKEISLIDTILDWKKQNIPIILSTHYPESERVQNLVDYYIFDKNQHMDPKLTVKQFYGCSSFKIVAKANRPYHAAAGLISLQNAIRMVGDKFDFVYLQDYDVKLNKTELLKTVRSFYPSPFDLFMFNWKGDPESYATNVCFFKQGVFNKIWGDIQSVDDYLDLVRLVDKNNNIFIERLARDLINHKNLQDSLYLFDNEQTKTFLRDFSEHSADVIEPRVYLSSTSSGEAVLFLVNPAPGTLTFKIQTKNLINGQENEQIQNLTGRVSMYWKLYNNVYIKVTCGNIEKSYFVEPFSNFKECEFEFFDNTQLFMKK